MSFFKRAASALGLGGGRELPPELAPLTAILAPIAKVDAALAEEILDWVLDGVRDPKASQTVMRLRGIMRMNKDFVTARRADLHCDDPQLIAIMTAAEPCAPEVFRRILEVSVAIEGAAQNYPSSHIDLPLMTAMRCALQIPEGEGAPLAGLAGLKQVDAAGLRPADHIKRVGSALIACKDVKSPARPHAWLLRAMIGRAPSHVALLIDLKSWNTTGIRRDVMQFIATDPEFSADFALVDLLFGLARKKAPANPRDDLAGMALDKMPLGALIGFLDWKLEATGAPVSVREKAVELLTRREPEEARDARLRALLEAERTDRLREKIEEALRGPALIETDDDATGYAALDGTRVSIPPRPALQDGVFPGEDQIPVLIAAIEAHRAAEREAKAERRYATMHLWEEDGAEELARRGLAFLQNPVEGELKPRGLFSAFRHAAPQLRRWAEDAALALPEQVAFEAAARFERNSIRSIALGGWRENPNFFVLAVDRFLNSPRGDLRVVEDAMIARMGMTALERGRGEARPVIRGDMIRDMMQDRYGGWCVPYEAAVIAPSLAENLEVIEEAMGLRDGPANGVPVQNALTFVGLLPKTPLRLRAGLYALALGDRKQGRAQAQALLAQDPQLVETVAAKLSDALAEVRIEAAGWLGRTGDAAAVAPLQARLKTEKAERARAAILSALGRLGVDLSDLLSPAILEAEAQKGLKPARLAELEKFGLSHPPALRWKGGAPLPGDVARWWVSLAVKLKEPQGSPLLDLYLERLEPEDATMFSAWAMERWMHVDLATQSLEEAEAYADANAAIHGQYYFSTAEDPTAAARAALIAQQLKLRSQSAAPIRGALALTRRMPAGDAARAVMAWMKKDSSRVTQAKALLECLGGRSEPEALQTVVWGAAKIKQKTVRARADALLEEAAERMGWTRDELADRTVPSAGMDRDGVLELPCGEDEKLYAARIDGKPAFVLFNPAGKIVKSLPAGVDPATKASKKAFSDAKRELKQTVEMQTVRLLEAMCAQRSWPAAEWMKLFHAHPVMRRLIERLVWAGLDEAGAMVGAFRPTAEGEFTDVEDEPVDPLAFAAIRIAFGTGTPGAADWPQHFADYEVKPLFPQMGADLPEVTADIAKAEEIDDRKGWMSTVGALRSFAEKLGWAKSDPIDGGGVEAWIRRFEGAGFAAVIQHTGFNQYEEPTTALGVKTLHFERLTGGRARGAVPLGEVPPALVSVCWAEYRKIAAKGAFDPEWEKKGAW